MRLYSDTVIRFLWMTENCVKKILFTFNFLLLTFYLLVVLLFPGSCILVPLLNTFYFLLLPFYLSSCFQFSILNTKYSILLPFYFYLVFLSPVLNTQYSVLNTLSFVLYPLSFCLPPAGMASPFWATFKSQTGFNSISPRTSTKLHFY